MHRWDGADSYAADRYAAVVVLFYVAIRWRGPAPELQRAQRGQGAEPAHQPRRGRRHRQASARRIPPTTAPACENERHGI